MQNLIEYTKKGIVITLPCADPSALHARLLQSIASSIAYSSFAEKNTNYGDEVAPLMQLMKALLPDEMQLDKMTGR